MDSLVSLPNRGLPQLTVSFVQGALVLSCMSEERKAWLIRTISKLGHREGAKLVMGEHNKDLLL